MYLGDVFSMPTLDDVLYIQLMLEDFLKDDDDDDDDDDHDDHNDDDADADVGHGGNEDEDACSLLLIADYIVCIYIYISNIVVLNLMMQLLVVTSWYERLQFRVSLNHADDVSGMASLSPRSQVASHPWNRRGPKVLARLPPSCNIRMIYLCVRCYAFASSKESSIVRFYPFHFLFLLSFTSEFIDCNFYGIYLYNCNSELS